MHNEKYELVSLVNYMVFIYAVMATIFVYNISKYYINRLKTVTIIRGVPGIGKDTLVDYIEKNKNDMEVFSICNDDKYFIDNNTEFSIKKLEDAKNYSMRSFIECIKQGVNRIYITNINSSIKDYENYISLARIHNYKVNIITIESYNKEHTTYFAKRSKHNISEKHLQSLTDNWENDPREETIDPYIPCLPGDTLPQNKKSLRILNKELDDYSNNSEESEESESEEESEVESEVESEESESEESESYKPNIKLIIKKINFTDKYSYDKDDVIPYLSEEDIYKNYNRNLNIHFKDNKKIIYLGKFIIRLN